VFIYGMRVMSDGLQKIAGERLHSILNYMTKNRVAAVFTGLAVTGIIQSSSATTIMVVTFVNAGLLKLSQAIGVIMGANIGTTVTGWIVSVFGFKFKISAVAFPAMAIGFPLMFCKDRNKKDLSEVLIGFGLLFLGLNFLKDAVPNVKDNPEMLEWLADYTNIHWFLHFLLFVAVGTILTVIMQSSSATMAVTITLAFNGLVDFPSAAAMVLGENIGTTIKANLVSIGARVNARRAARVHTIFNLAGVLWMVFLFSPLLRPAMLSFLDAIVPTPLMDAGPAGQGPQWISRNIPLHLSMFHTLFNLTNTAIFICFVPKLARLVTRLVPDDAGADAREYKLQYIASTGQDSPAAHLVNARSELTSFARVDDQMLDMFTEFFRDPRSKSADNVDALREKEELTDAMHEELSKFLAQCAEHDLSERSADAIAAMIRIASELETIGDCCYRLALLTQNRSDKKTTFHEDAPAEVEAYAGKVKQVMGLYINHMADGVSDREQERAREMAEELRRAGKKMIKASRRRIQSGASVKSELLYIDILRQLDLITDCALSICRDLTHLD